MKTIKESVLENLSSLSPVKSPAKAMMISRDLLNDSFYKLPEDIQFKVLSIGHDIDELLRQLKVRLNTFIFYELILYCMTYLFAYCYRINMLTIVN
jgi:hypothetical protein